MIDPKRYLRAPFDVVDGVFSEEIKTHLSPDQSMKLVISHCWNYKPGSNPGLFHLLDFSDNIIESFKPHTTNGHLAWTKDSRYLAIDIGENQKGILVIDTMLMQAALIRTNCRDFHIENEKIVISISEKFMERINSDLLIGGGTSQLPRIKYEKPTDLAFPINSLPFYPKSNIPAIFKLTEKQKEVILDPIANGFWEFKGSFPQNTVDGFNNRDFEMYQLETFAAYGDAQSLKWLEEIKAMNKPYEKWDKVVDYLGERKRDVVT